MYPLLLLKAAQLENHVLKKETIKSYGFIGQLGYLKMPGVKQKKCATGNIWVRTFCLDLNLKFKEYKYKSRNEFKLEVEYSKFELFDRQSFPLFFENTNFVRFWRWYFPNPQFFFPHRPLEISFCVWESPSRKKLKLPVVTLLLNRAQGKEKIEIWGGLMWGDT